MNWEQFKKSPVDNGPDEFIPNEFNHLCGAVAWPGKRPGFVIIVGAARDGNLYVVTEYESLDMRELALHCMVLDQSFPPGKWVGDSERSEVVQLLSELNRDGGKSFQINPLWPWLLESTSPYQAMLPKIRMLGKPDRQKLVLRGSTVENSLNEINDDEIFEMKFGDFPSIEALAFAVMGVKDLVEMAQYDYNDKRDQGVQTCDLLTP